MIMAKVRPNSKDNIINKYLTSSNNINSNINNNTNNNINNNINNNNNNTETKYL